MGASKLLLLLLVVASSLLLADNVLAQADAASPWEALYMNIPNRARAYEHLAYYTSLPHIAGSPEDYETAVWTNNKFKSFGLDSQIQAVPVLLTLPVSRSLELVAPAAQRFTAGLQEAPIGVDPTTSDPRSVPTFNGYSPSGDVTAELVYVNYGMWEDFQYLQSQGISVQGKICIARYGGIFRGVKAMIAQQLGAVGLIIYSDPQDDGYVQGKVFPDGPWRPETGVQRGSVQYLSICAGDPRRPVCGGNKPNYNYTEVIPQIPVQPISWGDAQPFLKAIGGPEAPSNFQGGLPLKYHIGPGPAVAHLNLKMNFFVSDIWNVIATIPADPNSPTRDEIILMGNHRDAWVFGAADPNSGTAVMLEMARGYGELLQRGWKPKRKIIIASWDGEEYGLLGSTAYAEANAATLSRNCVLYMNVDVAVTGSTFGASATPSLVSFIRDATKSVVDPNSGKTLYEVWDRRVSILGSGSDFTAFLDNLGIASLDMGFGGPYGVYHSVYDSQRWMNDWGTPTYTYYVALAQLWGIMGIRMADNELALNWTEYGAQLFQFYKETENLLHQFGGQNLVNISQIKTAVSDLAAAATRPNAATQFRAERFFLGPGLPRRPWYRHVVQAPGLYLGYGADTFPGLKQAIRDRNWTQAQQQANILRDVIYSVSSALVASSTN
jgi:N-acetylated-alpha-linked acidic dipeptidase